MAGHIARIAIELEQSHLALKEALVKIKTSEDRLRTIIDTIPALAWSARPDGSAEFINKETQHPVGPSFNSQNPGTS
jgi:PAS domain-containing protein